MSIIDLSQNNTLIAHAERELAYAGISSPSSPDGGKMANWALSLIRLISTQDQNPQTIRATLEIVLSLSLYQLLSPLTGAESEWESIRDGKQINKRFRAVYRDETGVYNSCGIMWVSPGKGMFYGELANGAKSTVPLKLPCFPKALQIEVNGDETEPLHPEHYEQTMAYYMDQLKQPEESPPE